MCSDQRRRFNIATTKMHNQSKPRQLHLPKLQAVQRFNNFPIVESGWFYAGTVYNRIKNSNSLFCWTFDQAENSIYNVIDTASPAVFLFEGPISKIDQIICKSLDIVEQKVPSIHLPPKMIYSNTKQYVSDVGEKIVRPVLKRADSVKQIGNSVLASKYTAFAADKLDGALDIADKYVEKYLPADVFDSQGNEDVASEPVVGPAGKAIQTSQHMYRFSKKLQRRLTKRTLLEAKALKDQSAEAIHVLVYVAELIATDPKMALQKGRELWMSLSKDEPENQARPENMEQLIVLLTRETARRVVHLVNFTAQGVGKIPRRVSRLVHGIANSCFQLLDTILKDQLVQQLAQQSQQSQQQQKKTTSVSITNSSPEVETKPMDRSWTSPSSPKNPQSTTYQHQQSSSIIQDTLRPPPVTRTQLKATHRSVPNVSNGEFVVKS
ncbi:PREDICTED: lipid storage droplets surface-binding protein 1-like isoform X2 [Nicrophorus vespilloides]|uniref:Lipid storage droplets surface-binding protein 1-like isoform X2 n=1 Tax=Nicrophorus vespilloides TaxID=110193 RepID=A0ABM1MCN1_NICVS|nr:PREDICTED: lipid storage droplets surface-binding protein 1-like isoform X2 [Nicrophorus vespilloides]